VEMILINSTVNIKYLNVNKKEREVRGRQRYACSNRLFPILYNF